MKTKILIIILATFSLFSCESDDFQEPSEATKFIIEGAYDFSQKHFATKEDSTIFSDWVESLTTQNVNDIYEKGLLVMEPQYHKGVWSDIRSGAKIDPFSYKDSITFKSDIARDSLRPLFFVKDEGVTKICFKDLLIFNCTWGYLYQDNHLMMTQMYFNKVNDYKILFVFNESYYGEYIFFEQLFFIADKNDILVRINANSIASYKINAIKYLDNDIIVISSYDFPRSQNHGKNITIFSLKTKQYKLFDL